MASALISALTKIPVLGRRYRAVIPLGPLENVNKAYVIKGLYGKVLIRLILLKVPGEKIGSSPSAPGKRGTRPGTLRLLCGGAAETPISALGFSPPTACPSRNAGARRRGRGRSWVRETSYAHAQSQGGG